jgi:hypothetical protein
MDFDDRVSRRSLGGICLARQGRKRESRAEAKFCDQLGQQGVVGVQIVWRGPVFGAEEIVAIVDPRVDIFEPEWLNRRESRLTTSGMLRVCHTPTPNPSNTAANCAPAPAKAAKAPGIWRGSG